MVRSVLAIFILLLLGSTSLAKSPPILNSVSVSCGQAECVVVGRIRKVEKLASPPGIEKEHPFRKLTVDVQEKIKGAVGQSVIVFDDGWPVKDEFVEGAEGIFFLVSGATAAKE